MSRTRLSRARLSRTRLSRARLSRPGRGGSRGVRRGVSRVGRTPPRRARHDDPP
ncbi:hypothetical protein AB0N17_24990 [Streptomyces sp. NPDC051133]|uniref:hypothetical protein n=1 Tax=Streptomyces sp. NPDC051133 TaxID=3155521 RepID=UPI0034472C68